MATGGGDAPEDVFGGLEKALALSWSTTPRSKVIFHMADAPCHGRDFHTLGGDSYPGGDPQGRSHYGLFGEILSLGIQYHFGKITSHTDRMIEKFSAAYDAGGAGAEKMIVCDISTADRILDSVVSMTSIAVTAMGPPGVGGTRRRAPAVPKFDVSTPDWEKIPVVKGLLLSYELPESIDDIVNAVSRGF